MNVTFFTESPKLYWHKTAIRYNRRNISDAYCEFYQYYPDKSYTPEFYVYLDKGKWGMMVR